MKNISYIGHGIYTLREASKLLHRKSYSLHYWVSKNPLWETKFSTHNKTTVISFLDLVELMYVCAFRDAGLSWNAIRALHKKAEGKYDSRYPFCTNRFFTDGHTLYEEEVKEAKNENLYDFRNEQKCFKKIISEFIKNIEFDGQDLAVRWWPLSTSQPLVVDPELNFGQPTVSQSGVKALIIKNAYYACKKSVEDVCRWYKVSHEEVKASLSFDEKFAA